MKLNKGFTLGKSPSVNDFVTLKFRIIGKHMFGPTVFVPGKSVLRTNLATNFHLLIIVAFDKNKLNHANILFVSKRVLFFWECRWSLLYKHFESAYHCTTLAEHHKHRNTQARKQANKQIEAPPESVVLFQVHARH